MAKQTINPPNVPYKSMTEVRKQLDHMRPPMIMGMWGLTQLYSRQSSDGKHLGSSLSAEACRAIDELEWALNLAGRCHERLESILDPERDEE